MNRNPDYDAAVNAVGDPAPVVAELDAALVVDSVNGPRIPITPSTPDQEEPSDEQ